MFVKLTHVYGFWVGPIVPDSQVKGPFSLKRPLRELQPGPPLNLRELENREAYVIASQANVPHGYLILGFGVR